MSQLEKKEKKKKEYPNSGTIPISEFECDQVRDIQAKVAGLEQALRVIAAELGETQIRSWELWDRMHKLHDYPQPEDGYIVRVDHGEKAIVYRKRGN